LAKLSLPERTALMKQPEQLELTRAQLVPRVSLAQPAHGVVTEQREE
jgi:hypothetical protein